MKEKILTAIIALTACLAAAAREKVNINLGWKFIRENVAMAEAAQFDDSKWQTVDLPHDAAVYHAFQKEGDGASSRVGFLPLGRGWYRKHISYDPSWRGRRVVLEFEGVYRDARVFVNGIACGGEHPNGYIDFTHDITDMLREGDNVLAVSLTQGEGGGHIDYGLSLISEYIPTGIDAVTAGKNVPSDADNRVYSLSGTYLGTSTDGLKKGIYIVGGKKKVTGKQ